MQNKVLVICVDRDNDLGIKTRIFGPIIGRKANLHAANELALKDPTDSDVNALFQAIKVYDELAKTQKVEIVTLTGDAERGIKSDRRMVRQLEKTVSDFAATEAILVSDGEDDEYVIPLLRSKIKLIYPQKVIVKQSARLEGAYYMIYDFLKNIQADPKMARMFFGIPAIALIIYALFGSAGWRLILGVVGAFFLIKGFKLENYVYEWIEELKIAIYHKKLSFLLYLVSLSVAIIAAFIGYNAVVFSGIDGIFYSVVKFVNSSVFIFTLAALIVGFGKAHSRKMKLISLAYYLVILGILAIISFTVTEYLLTPSIGYANIIYSIGVSVVALFLLHIIEGKR